MENSKSLKDLIKSQEESRKQKDDNKSTSIFKEILELIKNLNDNSKFDIISKLFLFEDQSNYTKIFIFNELLKNNHFIKSKSSKRKYYQLLIDSFTNNKINDHSEQVTKLKELYDKSDLNDFEELDMYIEIFTAEKDMKTNIDNFNDDITDREFVFDENKEIKETKEKKGKRKININSIEIQTTKETESKDGNNNNNQILFNSSPKEKINSNNFKPKNINLIEFNNYLPDDVNIDPNNLDKFAMKKYKPNPALPMIILSVSANLNSFQFLMLINQTFHKYNYTNISTIKDTEFDNLRIYEFKPKNCFNYIPEIFKTKGKCVYNQFHVYSTLKRDENNFSGGINTVLNDSYERKIAIKSIKGIESNIVNFLIQFLKSFCQSIERIKVIKQSNCFNKYDLDNLLYGIIIQEKKSKINVKSKLINLKNKIKHRNYKKIKNEDESYIGLNKSVTTTSTMKYFQIFKILSNPDYGLGKKIADFVDDFKKRYNPPINNVESVDTRSIMMKIIKLFEFETSNLNTSFNNKNNEYDTNYIMMASEQYIFNKIYFILFNIYCEKYKKQNEEIIKIQKEINEKYKTIEICNKLQVNSIYLGEEQDPFKSVINIINQIQFEKFLHKKFEILTQASLEIRKCILEYTDGKFELESMDDELPIIIFISTQVKVDNFIAELNMLDDYIKCSMRDNLVQNKMVTNLLSSLMYLSKSWNSKTASFD